MRRNTNLHLLGAESAGPDASATNSALGDQFKDLFERIEQSDQGGTSDTNSGSEEKKSAHAKKIKKFTFDRLDFYVKVFIDDVGGTFLLRTLDDNTCRRTTIDSLASLIGEDLRIHNIEFTAEGLRKLIKTWIDGVKKLRHLPVSFSLDPHELTFNRIAVNFLPGECPTWDSFIERLGPNAEAVKAFIYSLFDPKDLSRQYLFLKGEGRDGKGSLIRWLNTLFNDQLAGLDAKNDHWPSMCVGKRVGVFNDLVNTGVVLSSQFKQITGGDKVTITQKYEKAIDVTLDTKFIMTTNKAASFLTTEAERRRVIYVEITPPKELVEGYESKLKQETNAFLFKCREAYERLYQKDLQHIQCDYSFFEEAASSFEETTEALFDLAFEECPNSYIKASTFVAILNHHGVRDAREISKLKEWMARNRGISRQQKVIGDKRVRVYPGIKAAPLSKNILNN